MSQITSSTEICNLALQRIGEDTITSLDQATERARRCNLAYPQTRDAMLRTHPWNFAIKRADLAANAEVPTWEYSHSYALPDDFLRLLRTNLDIDAAWSETSITPEYRVEGKNILTNAGALQIEYIFRNEDITRYDDLFIDAFISRLSAELAASFKKSQGSVQQLWQIADLKLREARFVDGQEGSPRPIEANIFIQARY